MIGRFVRFASVGFALLFALYWIGIASFVQITFFVGEQTELSSGAKWAVQAVPTILYALTCVLFCQWFGRGIVRRVNKKGTFE